MKPEFLVYLKRYFSNYVRSFRTSDNDYNHNINLKESHTRNVCHICLEIGDSLSVSPNDQRILETAALLHDIGRFEQYRRYHSFLDVKTENHALLGLEIISDLNLLQPLSSSEQTLITTAVRQHNLAALPVNMTPKQQLCSQVLRDADKLDIWRVVTEYYHRNNDRRNGVLELGLPDTPKVSEEVIQELVRQEIVRIEHIRTLNDFKLLQLSWVFDINYRRSFQILQDRSFAAKIRAVLPDIRAVEKAYRSVNAYLNEKV